MQPEPSALIQYWWQYLMSFPHKQSYWNLFNYFKYGFISISCGLPEAYTEPFQKSKTELFAKIANGWKLLTIFTKGSILDDWQRSEYASSTFCVFVYTHCIFK